VIATEERHYIKAIEHLECAMLLVRHGADVNSVYQGKTLWEHALINDAEKTAILLIENRARIPSTSPFLQAALSAAVRSKNLTAAQYLISAGASVHMKLNGKSAIQLAENSDDKVISAFFAEQRMSVQSKSSDTDLEDIGSNLAEGKNDAIGSSRVIRQARDKVDIFALPRRSRIVQSVKPFLMHGAAICIVILAISLAFYYPPIRHGKANPRSNVDK
jgi:ankyrin repeat protein